MSMEDANLKFNKVTLVGENNYHFSSGDPHIIYRYSSRVKTNNLGIWLDIKLTSSPAESSPRSVPAQFFWSTKPSQKFNKRDGFRFEIQFSPQSPIIYIPVGRLADSITALRLDIDGCECTFEISPLRWVKDKAEFSSSYPPGIESFLDLKFGRDVPVADWGGMEVGQPAPGIFTFNGYDPRILNSTPLDIPLDIVSGIYFEFDYNLLYTYQKYELFWGIKNLGWSQLRSAHFVLTNNDTTQTRKQVYLPFNRIHSKKILSHLRLDFNACPSCVFELKKTRLVGYAEADEYQQYIPERLYYVHTEAPPKEILANAIVQKLGKDKAFWSVFSFCVVLLLGLIIYTLFRLLFSINKNP